MKQKISVDKAIYRAYLTIFLPMLIIYIAFIIFVIDFFLEFAVIGSLIAFPISLLYWIFAITSWRIWAFENVINVHQLKKRAIQEQLIWKTNNWLSKIEYESSSNKLKWEQLKKRFNEDEDYDDSIDLSLPNSYTIYYSKKKIIWWLIVSLIEIWMGIAFAEYDKNDLSKVTPLFFLLFGVFQLLYFLKLYFNSDPQIIINDKGIKTAKKGFRSWSEIKNIRTAKRKYTYYLLYEHLNKKEKITINYFKISHKRLDVLLKTYKIRSKKKDKFTRK